MTHIIGDNMTEMKGWEEYGVDENAVVNGIEDFESYIDPADMTLAECAVCWLSENWDAINKRDGHHFEYRDIFLSPCYSGEDNWLEILGSLYYDNPSAFIHIDEELDGIWLYESEIVGKTLKEVVEMIIHAVQAEFERLFLNYDN